MRRWKMKEREKRYEEMEDEREKRRYMRRRDMKDENKRRRE